MKYLYFNINAIKVVYRWINRENSGEGYDINYK